MPGLYGYVSATKWLSEIELTTLEAFDAYWVPLGWAKEAPDPDPVAHRRAAPGDQRVAAGLTNVAGVRGLPDRGVAGVEMQDRPRGLAAGDDLDPALEGERGSSGGSSGMPRRAPIRSSVRATDGDGDVQTDERTPPAPDGARGHHTITLSIT